MTLTSDKIDLPPRISLPSIIPLYVAQAIGLSQYARHGPSGIALCIPAVHSILRMHILVEAVSFGLALSISSDCIASCLTRFMLISSSGSESGMIPAVLIADEGHFQGGRWIIAGGSSTASATSIVFHQRYVKSQATIVTERRIQCDYR